MIQPTHLSSKTLAKDPRVDKTGPEDALFWRSRAEDITRIINGLDAIDASTPGLAGRIDRTRIAVVGHSMGGHTASLLLGMTLTDPESGMTVDLTEPRINAGIVLGAPGNGGADLSAFAAENYPMFSRPNFAGMKTRTLVVAGD